MSEGTFQHGVASGDPLDDSVVIWTRITTAEEDVPVEWTLARDAELRDPVAAGGLVASATRDHTVHVDVGGLEPGTTYHYGFSVLGADSEVGRTRTLPGKGAGRVRFATCSCAKFNAGFFNAYARIADRDELDFLLHLGDYIYEAANKPAGKQTPGADIGRPFEPEGECRTLAEYRTRYAQYRRDPDVQRLHRSLPVIAALDDHELADGAWAEGADEHRPDEHGPWSERREAAFRARWEWLPARPPDPADPSRVFRRVSMEGLADILICDIRSRRDQPMVGPGAADPARSMLGSEQRDWLFNELERSDAPWRVLAMPAILTRTWCESPEPVLLEALLKLKLIDDDGDGPDEDQWDGYPAERDELLRRIAAAGDTVVTSADIHISAATDVPSPNGDPVAVELTSPSLTSQNLDEKLKVEPRSEPILAAERAYTDALNHVRWCELASHGYVLVDLTPDRVRAEWWHVDGVLEPLDGETLGAAFEVSRGERVLRSAGT